MAARSPPSSAATIWSVRNSTPKKARRPASGSSPTSCAGDPKQLGGNSRAAAALASDSFTCFQCRLLRGPAGLGADAWSCPGPCVRITRQDRPVARGVLHRPPDLSRMGRILAGAGGAGYSPADCSVSRAARTARTGADPARPLFRAGRASAVLGLHLSCERSDRELDGPDRRLDASAAHVGILASRGRGPAGPCPRLPHRRSDVAPAGPKAQLPHLLSLHLTEHGAGYCRRNPSWPTTTAIPAITPKKC